MLSDDTLDTGFYLIAVAIIVLLGGLIVRNVKDELWRRENYSSNFYMAVFTHEAIALKTALIVLVMLLMVEQFVLRRSSLLALHLSTNALHHLQLLCILFITLHRVHGRQVVQQHVLHELSSAALEAEAAAEAAARRTPQTQQAQSPDMEAQS